jgi:polynucleotide 5'-kinase involved in rRNA processing
MPRVSQAEIVESLLGRKGTIALLGGIDTGKTSFGLSLAEAARAAGLKAAYIDADVGQSSVGPPTCVGLKFTDGLERVALDTVGIADEIGFVGAASPEGHLLPLVTATARLVTHAREAGCELIVVDTSGLISGVYAEILKYYKLEIIRPSFVLGFERGEELEPILGVIRRFLPVEVAALKVESAVVERSVEERLLAREERLRSYFKPPLSRWRVKTSVFMPSIPPGIELSRLDGLVVGLENGEGKCVGIGFLEYDASEDFLRFVSPVSEPAKGLRLGSIRVNAEGKTLGRVTVRDLFG